MCSIFSTAIQTNINSFGLFNSVFWTVQFLHLHLLDLNFSALKWFNLIFHSLLLFSLKLIFIFIQNEFDMTNRLTVSIEKVDILYVFLNSFPLESSYFSALKYLLHWLLFLANFSKMATLLMYLKQLNCIYIYVYLWLAYLAVINAEVNTQYFNSKKFTHTFSLLKM